MPQPTDPDDLTLANPVLITETAQGKSFPTEVTSAIAETAMTSVEAPSPQKLEKEDVEQLVILLDKLQRGYQPYEVFKKLAEKLVTPTIELLPIRTTESGEVQVLLTKRPDDDEFWPGQWHIPGSIILASDEEGSLKSAYSRVLDGELGGAVQPQDEPQLVGQQFWEVERGRELDALHYVVADPNKELPEEIGTFFPIDQLPENVIKHHQVMIPKIMEAYTKDKRPSPNTSGLPEGIVPLAEVPDYIQKGWTAFIDGKQVDVSSIVFYNDRMGTTISYGYNGSYDTVRIKELGGPVTIPYLYDVFDTLYIGLVQEYRDSMKGLVWNVPRGMVDPGENLVQAGKREMREETGHKIEHDKKFVQLSKGGNPNSAYFESDPEDLDQGYAVFAAEFDPKDKDIVPLLDENGVTVGYRKTIRQAANDASKEKVFDMVFVKATQALQTITTHDNSGETAEVRTRDGYTAAAMGYLLTHLLADELDSVDYHTRLQWARDEKERLAYAKYVRDNGLIGSAAHDPRHDPPYSWEKDRP